MKKHLFSRLLLLSLLVSFIPLYTAGAEAEFITVFVDCPDAEIMQGENYQDYSHLMLRYADDKTPIALSTPYDGRMCAIIPAENKDRPLEHFISQEDEFADAPSPDDYGDASFAFYIVSRVSASGIMKGNEKHEALPFNNVTRAEAVAMTMRLLGVDNMPDTNSGFID